MSRDQELELKYNLSRPPDILHGYGDRVGVLSLKNPESTPDPHPTKFSRDIQRYTSGPVPGGCISHTEVSVFLISPKLIQRLQLGVKGVDKTSATIMGGVPQEPSRFTLAFMLRPSYFVYETLRPTIAYHYVPMTVRVWSFVT